MEKRKRIVLIAHDRLKPALVEWARSHIEVLYDIPVANNRASADFLISSLWMGETYQTKPDGRIR